MCFWDTEFEGSWLVRNGGNVRLPPDRNGKAQHTRMNVYGEMMLQVARTYHGCPNVLEMDLEQIAFFYEGIRGELLASTKPAEN